MSFRRVACQDAGISANAEFLELIGPELGLLPELDEKARRLTLGAVARGTKPGVSRPRHAPPTGSPITYGADESMIFRIRARAYRANILSSISYRSASPPSGNPRPTM